MHLTADTKK